MIIYDRDMDKLVVQIEEKKKTADTLLFAFLMHKLANMIGNMQIE